jgi:hypothetical protein
LLLLFVVAVTVVLVKNWVQEYFPVLDELVDSVLVIDALGFVFLVEFELL